jgi:nucleoid DNA-binding protein
MADLYSDIYKYLADYCNDQESFIDNQEEMVAFIRAHTGLDKDKAEVIISAIFTEIMNVMLSGKSILLPELGRLYCGSLMKKKKLKKPRFIPRLKSTAKITQEINKDGNTK